MELKFSLNEKSMNKIETLPRNIQYGDFYYDLRMHITAWGKICLCYHSHQATEHCIFSQVIDSESEQTIRQNPAPEDIVDVFSFDAAVRVLEKRIKDAVKANLIKV